MEDFEAVTTKTIERLIIDLAKLKSGTKLDVPATAKLHVTAIVQAAQLAIDKP